MSQQKYIIGLMFLRFQAQGSSSSVTQSFFKEVILLPDDKTTHVPRRAKRAWLFENGHVKTALECGCGWDSDKIMHAITAAFQPAVEGCKYVLVLLFCFIYFSFILYYDSFILSACMY